MPVERVPPQPDPSRMTEFAGHPLVVSAVPGQSPLVALTAASLARATAAPAVYFAYVDTSRYTVEEFTDGTVHHEPVDPDLAGDEARKTEQRLTALVREWMDGQDVPWFFRYLAGREDRALTHLARAVDAAAFVIGAQTHGHRRVRDFLGSSLAANLSHRQHRPVLVVPVQVVDWRGRAPWE